MTRHSRRIVAAITLVLGCIAATGHPKQVDRSEERAHPCGRLVVSPEFDRAPYLRTSTGNGALSVWTYDVAGAATYSSIDLVAASSPRDIRPFRQVPHSVRLGEPATSTLTLTNSGRRTARLLARDAWVPSAGAQSNRHRVRVPGGETRRVRTVLVPSRRGDREADLVTLRSHGSTPCRARSSCGR